MERRAARTTASASFRPSSPFHPARKPAWSSRSVNHAAAHAVVARSERASQTRLLDSADGPIQHHACPSPVPSVAQLILISEGPKTESARRMSLEGTLTNCSRRVPFRVPSTRKNPKLVVNGGEQRQIAFCAQWQNRRELDTNG